MRVGVLGTGAVGQTLATRLVQLGHSVRLGARSASNERAAAWVGQTGAEASHGDFSDAATFGELVLNCTAGSGSLDALAAAGSDSLAGKILVDVANPLDFSGGMGPTLFVSGTDSLGEQIQSAFPDARVVKALNTVNHELMVEPGLLPTNHEIFVCGNDAAAKAEVRALLAAFGWPEESVRDLGDISGARATEAYLLLWVRLMGALGTARFNIRAVTWSREASRDLRRTGRSS